MPKYFVCDMDDCLLKTDTLYEQWFGLFKRKPLLFLYSLLFLLKGRTNFKQYIAKHSSLNVSSLPIRREVVELIKERKSKEEVTTVLASASPLVWVEAVSNHLGLFDFVLGTTDKVNLKGSNKLKEIQRITKDASFVYAGDHWADLAIWQQASEVVAINPSKGLQSKISNLNKPTVVIKDQKRNGLKLLIKQLRPHQWVKNALVFLPAFAGHKLLTNAILTQCLLAFVGFSLAASFVYVLNDLLDLNSDRNHHSKKNRPFASGDLSIKWGLVLLPLLLLGAGLCATVLPLPYFFWIGTYLVLNLAYSLYLKQSVVVDIIILSMMYTLRIFAGSAATEVPVSEWLLSFSTLFFFSLACVKRYTEIIRSKNKITIDGRGYRQIDYSMVQSLGVGSGLLSIVIILLYLQSKDVRSLYQNPQNLWFATPVLLFWISRVWILTNRDEVHDDPVVFAVKDKVSWICLAILAVVFGISA